MNIGYCNHHCNKEAILVYNNMGLTPFTFLLPSTPLYPVLFWKNFCHLYPYIWLSYDHKHIKWKLMDGIELKVADEKQEL